MILDQKTRNFILVRGKKLMVWDYYSRLFNKWVLEIGVLFKRMEQPVKDISPCMYWPIHCVHSQLEADAFIRVNSLSSMELESVSEQYKEAS